MAYYRLYFVDGHIRRVEEIDASTDTEALELAAAHEGAHALELWNHNRKVGRIEANDLGSMLIANRRDQRAASAAAEQERSKKA